MSKPFLPWAYSSGLSGISLCTGLVLAVRRDKLEVLYLLAVTADLRIGERPGPKWENVGLERGTLRV
jgi:hypothetical protein